MGNSSARCKSATKKMKQSRLFGARTPSPKKKKTKQKHKIVPCVDDSQVFKSTDIQTGAVIPRLDEGTLVCKKCERYAKEGYWDHKEHHHTCERSQTYKNIQRASKESQRVLLLAKKNVDKNTKTLLEKEKGTLFTSKDLIAFLQPRNSNSNSGSGSGSGTTDSMYCQIINEESNEQQPSLEQDVRPPINNLKPPPINDSSPNEKYLDIEWIKTELDERVNNPTKAMKCAINVPVQVAAMFDVILLGFPSRFDKDNKVMAGERSKQKVIFERYCKLFPAGRMGFTIKILNDHATGGSAKRASSKHACQSVISNERDVTNLSASQRKLTTLLAQLDLLLFK